MNIICRTATNDDLEKLLLFMEAYYAIESIAFDRSKSRQTILDFLSDDAFGQLRMIEMDGISIGYYCIAYSYTLENHGRDCFLDEIYIEPLYQRKGIGTKVMEFIETILRKDNFKAIHLIVYDNNKNAFRYYVRNGFKQHRARFMTKLLV
jgi:ribosomal protein S18 acetylase RimI-like enzyme